MSAKKLTNIGTPRIKEQAALHRLSDAARLLSLSRPTLTRWIRDGRLRAERTAGGHYRIPQGEIDRVAGAQPGPTLRDADVLSAISGRNKLMGTVTRVRFGGLLAEVAMAVGDQELTAIITSASARALGLKRGVRAYGLVKATEVMIVRA
jgi:molybdopterin-binding protein